MQKASGRSSFEASKVTDNEIYKFLTAHWHHHNLLSWSKLNVLLVLEVATLAGADAISAQRFWPIGVLVLGTLVGGILYLLILRDWEVRDSVCALLDQLHVPIGIRMIPRASSRAVHGQFLLQLLLVLLVVANVGAALYFWPKCG